MRVLNDLTNLELVSMEQGMREQEVNGSLASPISSSQEEIRDGILLESSRMEEYSQNPMNISLNLAQRRSKWAQVLCRAGLNGPKCFATQLSLTKVALVPQGVISGRIQGRKLLGMKAFNVMTCLGHVSTKLGFDEP